jgi:hypothetical protein
LNIQHYNPVLGWLIPGGEMFLGIIRRARGIQDQETCHMKQTAFWAWFASILVWAGPARQPILVELFTSEGCSSCPPADALLEKLDRTQPVDGAEIIVLSEHVDYWNHVGWADPFSSPVFSARQEQYVRRLGLSGAYTPQMVVDGRTEFVGSDAQKADGAIRSASREPKLAVRIAPSFAGVTVEVDGLPVGTAHKALVFAARASNSANSDVLRGENRGRRLHHVAIARELQQIGKVDRQSGFTVRLPVDADSRLIIIVQDPDSGKVLGTAMYRTPQL